MFRRTDSIFLLDQHRGSHLIVHGLRYSLFKFLMSGYVCFAFVSTSFPLNYEHV